MQQLAIGARDSESFAEIGRLFHDRLALDCTVDLLHLAPKLPVNEARAELEKLRTDPSVAVIMVVGSQVTNPMAIPIAEEVLRPSPSMSPASPPWLFRWGYRPSNVFLAANPPTPTKTLKSGSHLQGWPSPMQGIVDSTNPRTFLRRVSDDEIQKKRRSPGNRQVHFQDCGLLMIDARRRPLLVSAQSHAGAVLWAVCNC